MAKIWIICIDYGCEGIKEPFYAYFKKERAQQDYNMMMSLGTSFIKLIEVEIVE